MKIAGARVLYTSPALAFATAAFFAFPPSLLGLYVVGNALNRDRQSRIAPVVAASPVGSAEYLLGKLAGNLTILLAVTVGFMAAAMAMQVVRGEGPLEPLPFLAHFVVLCVPCVIFVSVVALVFECAPGQSGRAGDVAYLFVWCLLLPIGAAPWRADRAGGPSLLGAFDFMGLGFVIGQVQRITGTSHLTLGISPGDPAVPPVLFPGLDFRASSLLARSLSLLGPLLIAPFALVLFRRFDPARTRGAESASRHGLGGRLSAVARLAGRPVLALLDRVVPDAALAFHARPPPLLVAGAGALLAFALNPVTVRLGVLPVLFACLSIALADGPVRERLSGISGIVFTLPERRSRFVAWKLGSAILVAFVLAGIPAMRVGLSDPASGAAALGGLILLATASVTLGVATGTPKVFVATSLVLWYLGLNAKGRPSILDYGGWWGTATPLDTGIWLAAAAALVALAFVAQRLRSAREA